MGATQSKFGGGPLCTSRTAYMSGARALIRLGFDPDNLLVMWREGAEKVALRGRLGDAARVSVPQVSNR
jgi:hypothetical protein